MNSPGKGLYLTRRVEFSAAHRLYLDELSEEENFNLFGKCANRYGHGHNYQLETTWFGYPDRQTNMVIHGNRLKAFLQELVVEPLDHHNLNVDVEFMKNVLPTSENLVVRLWERLSRALEGQPCQLYRLKLASSSNQWVEYLG